MRRGYLAFSLALALLPACSDSSTEFWPSQNSLLPMVALENRVAYVETNSATAFVLDPASPSLVPTLAAVGKRPQLAVKHAGSNRLLVVSAGDPGSAEEAPIPAQLTLVDPNSADPHDPYVLASRFGAVAQSEEGRFVVLYNTAATKDTSDRGLYSPNEMAVLDFTDAPTAMPSLTPKLIRSLGDVPGSIRFSPVYSFPKAGQHRLAVVLSQSYLTIFDLLDLARSEISIPLCPSGGACNYRVDDVIFDPSNFSIYVRVRGAKDIFQIVLTESDVPDATLSYGFSASLSLLAVGASPGDMALYGTGPSARLAVVADNKTLVIIDPNTGRSAGISTAIPANKILPFTVPSQDPAVPKNKALLLDLQGGTGNALLVDLGSVEAGGSSEPRQYAISGAASSAFLLPTQGIAIVLFGRSATNAVLSVVKLAEIPSFFDFNSPSALGSPYIEVRNAGQSTRLWYVDSPTNDLPSPNSGIRFQDLALTGSANPDTAVWLDQAITSITALAGPSADGRRYLALEHVDPDAYGDVTFIDADNPDRSSARTARGFLFTDYLGRTQP